MDIKRVLEDVNKWLSVGDSIIDLLIIYRYARLFKTFFSEPLSEEVLINRIHMGLSNCTNKVITYMFV